MAVVCILREFLPWWHAGIAYSWPRTDVLMVIRSMIFLCCMNNVAMSIELAILNMSRPVEQLRLVMASRRKERGSAFIVD